MPRPRRAYVDTSVFGGTQDEEFRVPSVRFFERAARGEFLVLLSRVTLDELAGAPPDVQSVLTDLPPQSVDRLPVEVEREARGLADAYIAAEVLGPTRWDDAMHVAAATVGRANLVLSWNFRHIVNYDRIHGFNRVNELQGYSPVEIYSPLELMYGDQDEDV